MPTKLAEGLRRFKEHRPLLAAAIIFGLGIFVRFFLWGGSDTLFDWVLYPVVIHASTELWGAGVGAIAGTGIMMVLSAIICFIFLWVYDLAKADVLGLESEKLLVQKAVGADYAEYSKRSKLQALVSIVVWPIATDPFLTVVRLRPQGVHVMTEREWIVFSASVVIANVGWGAWTTLWVWGVAQAAPYIPAVLETLSSISPWITIPLAALIGSMFYCPKR
jgi:hypothetical protein